MKAFYIATMALVACSGTASVYIPSGGDCEGMDAEAGNKYAEPNVPNVILADAGVPEVSPPCVWECTEAGAMNSCDNIVQGCALTIELCNPVPAVCQGIPVCTLTSPGALFKAVCDPDASSFTWTDDAGCTTMPCATCIPGSVCSMYVPSIGTTLTGTCEPSQ